MADLDIEEIFESVISIKNPLPNSYPLGFELDSLKELFEFLMQFVTMLCKHFNGDSEGHVDLLAFKQDDFLNIDKYMQSIGFKCNFTILHADANNINWVNETRYDRIPILPSTELEELHLGLKCNTTLYVISFFQLDNTPKI
jgi:hypothetical protein